MKCEIPGTCCGHVDHRMAAYRAADEYLELLENGTNSPSLRARMDELLLPFHDNVAFIAFMRRKTLLKKKAKIMISEAIRYNASKHACSPDSAYWLTALTIPFQGVWEWIDVDGKLGPQTIEALPDSDEPGTDYNVRRYGLPETAAGYLEAMTRAWQSNNYQTPLLADGKLGPQTQTALAISASTLGAWCEPEKLVAQAESYLGTPYDFGAMNPLAGMDCSGLVKITCSELGLSMPARGSWAMMRYFRDNLALLPVDVASRMPGAILYNHRSGTPWSGGRPGSSHIAIVARKGETIEARPGHGTYNGPIEGRPWSYAGLLPGVEYAWPF